MVTTVIIYGPPACGKTRHAKAIAHTFGIPEENIVDCWNDNAYRSGNTTPLRPGYLHLTQRGSAYLDLFRGGDVIIKAFSDLTFQEAGWSADSIAFTNPIRWFYAFSEDAESWFLAGDSREEALAHARGYPEPVWIVAAKRLEPGFKLFDAEELMERISEDECWGEDGWDGMPAFDRGASEYAELENELANALRRWVVKHGSLSGADLDFIHGPDLAPKPEAV